MESFRVSVYRVASFTVIKIRGDLDALTSTTLRKTTADAFSHQPAGIIFDLSELTFIDSTGIRVILDTCQTLGHGKAAVASPSPRVEGLFARLGLTARLAIYATTLDAVRDLTAEP
jgi:anti-sigma B factor antagonist